MAAWGTRFSDGPGDGRPDDGASGRADDDASGQTGDGSGPVGLGALCDLRAEPGSATSQAFDVQEFVVLASGRRVVLHSERGFAVGSRGFAVRELTQAHVRESVLRCVLPDDDADHEPHPWAWLAELARAKGVDVTAAELEALPYEVILTERLTAWLQPS